MGTLLWIAVIIFIVLLLLNVVLFIVFTVLKVKSKAEAKADFNNYKDLV